MYSCVILVWMCLEIKITFNSGLLNRYLFTNTSVIETNLKMKKYRLIIQSHTKLCCRIESSVSCILNLLLFAGYSRTPIYHPYSNQHYNLSRRDKFMKLWPGHKLECMIHLTPCIFISHNEKW